MKKIYRYFFPVQKSSYTLGTVEDICAIHLVPPEDLQLFFHDCIQRLQTLKGDNVGDYLEFGVFNGSSMGSMYESAQDMSLNTMSFFGFDAFQGLPEDAEHEDDGVRKKGFYTCSFEQMQNCLKKKGINPDDINRVQGWYEDTLTDHTAKELGITNPGVVFIDCDTYSSTKTVLTFLEPLLQLPAILCFDDWKLNNLDIKDMGEYKAFNEFLEANQHFKVQEIRSYNRKSRSFLIFPR